MGRGRASIPRVDLRIDTQVARLVQHLDQSRHAEDTLVVLWSDHGFHLGEKFHWQKLALW